MVPAVTETDKLRELHSMGAYISDTARWMRVIRWHHDVFQRCRTCEQVEIQEDKTDALLIGPGMGVLSDDAATALHGLIKNAGCPVILDADALTTAAKKEWPLPAHVLVTPHPGEMRRLMGSMKQSRAHVLAGMSPAISASQMIAQLPPCMAR